MKKCTSVKYDVEKIGNKKVKVTKKTYETDMDNLKVYPDGVERPVNPPVLVRTEVYKGKWEEIDDIPGKSMKRAAIRRHFKLDPKKKVKDYNYDEVKLKYKEELAESIKTKKVKSYVKKLMTGGENG